MSLGILVKLAKNIEILDEIRDVADAIVPLEVADEVDKIVVADMAVGEEMIVQVRVVLIADEMRMKGLVLREGDILNHVIMIIDHVIMGTVDREVEADPADEAADTITIEMLIKAAIIMIVEAIVVVETVGMVVDEDKIAVEVALEGVAVADTVVVVAAAVLI